ncbi:PhoD-like phosphatase [Waterburya agarophytonicola K14]|uniref:PhoD-like phosphatase n=1 Tax=Waterburya agarophytonicola KI4 TaxID=2874699 RepID=A0A964BV67_9CYAN|nr:PhoD-like phosphatase [Waterburya agarophytonicola]MCC0178697.1 PhoD-like phosphatase [Waterburya agarophytonicola KI4]
MNSSPSVFEYLPKIQDLPLILAGPILRRTESDRVTVWLALKESRSLRLEIYETENNGTIIGDVVLEGRGDTIKLGKHLHILTLTAQKNTGKLLQTEKIYAYNVYCNHHHDQTKKSDRYSLIDDLKTSIYSLSYFAHQLPTFSLPPQDLNHLKIIHGSCRKPHGGGKDTLSYVDNLILESARSATERPHQLFLTGDQIYGDDVADPILWLAQGVSKLLFGWSEELPLVSGSISSDDLLPGQRTKIAEIEGGLTAMLVDTPEEAKSHLMSFGEYAAAYLLAWSPVFIPAQFPTGRSLFKDSKQGRNWQQEIKDIKSFVRDLNYVRRGLANIPVYTICDDHDISDDWYLNREWCDRVLGKPLGKRIIQNGILAYGLFQAWGNTPQHFEPGKPGKKLLHYASQWLASQGKDELAKLECDRYLGIPATDASTGKPQLESDENVMILARDSQAIPWHYTINGNNHEVIVLDTRTWRGYPIEAEKGLAPPMLLSPKAFKQQLEVPLSQSKSTIEATIIVLPTNLIALSIIDRIQQIELKRDQVFNSDVGDSWNFHTAAFAQFLLTLCQQRRRVIILSGDIHYSCAVRLSHWFYDSSEGSVLVQLTSSAIKNSEVATRLAHTKLKSLFPEKTKAWLGWNQPLKIEQITKHNQKQKYLNSVNSLPDWQYRVEWCKRQPAQSLSWQKLSPKLTPKGYSASDLATPNIWQKTITGLFLWLWRNRWLQEGSEVIGRNNLSLVRFDWSTNKTVIQETYWHPPWNDRSTVKSSYVTSLEIDPLPKVNSRLGTK